jgi:hypothetical protein
VTKEIKRPVIKRNHNKKIVVSFFGVVHNRLIMYDSREGKSNKKKSLDMTSNLKI